ncbi:MFS transporter [Brevibacterium sp. JNUCC-42]|nr:MFS transporter [Brevibacterium sp. JNUCC-42]
MKADEPGILARQKSYITLPEMQKQVYKRTLLIVAISQIFGGAGLVAGVTVGALLAQDMLGTDSLTGIPAALFTVGSALAAFIVGRLSQRFGRRTGLATGFMAGGIGAIGVVIAAVSHNILLLFVSLFIYGAGTAANLQARYAGTDLAMPTQRAKAISIVMVSTTFGAFIGPNLVDFMGKFATSIGVPYLAGAFILAAVAYILASLVLFIFLRPDPFVVAKTIAEANQKDHPSSGTDMHSNILAINNRGIIVGTIVMIVTQVVMIAIMTMTPVHMKHHCHSLSAVGLVIGIHVGAMYLTSLVTGVLVDKVGRITMSFVAGVILLAAGILSAIVPADSILGLIIALALLGIGWNFGLISGTALIVDSTDPATRAKTQGTIDVLIALVGAAGGALSGMIVTNMSYATLSFAGGGLSLLLIPVGVWYHNNRKVEESKNLM